MENDIILKLDVAKGELLEALVNGGDNLSDDNKVRGRIMGLEMAKSIIHLYFEELSNFNDDDDAEEE